jgi:hypothetical protein
MVQVRELPNVKMACIITYGAMRRNFADEEIFGVYDMHDIPYVGEFNHWNIRKVTPVYKNGEKFYDIRTGKPVLPKKNTKIWPLFTGTVLKYPNGQKMLLSRRFNAERSIVVLDITGEERPANTTTLTVRN